MVDPTGEISKSVAQTLRNWGETLSNNNLLELADFEEWNELDNQSQCLQVEETPKR